MSLKEAEEVEIDLSGFDECINRRASKALCCPECGSWVVGDDFEEGDGGNFLWVCDCGVCVLGWAADWESN